MRGVYIFHVVRVCVCLYVHFYTLGLGGGKSVWNIFIFFFGKSMLFVLRVVLNWTTFQVNFALFLRRACKCGVVCVYVAHKCIRTYIRMMGYAFFCDNDMHLKCYVCFGENLYFTVVGSE